MLLTLKPSQIIGNAYCFVKTIRFKKEFIKQNLGGFIYKESDACPELVEGMTCFACGRPVGT